MLNDLTPENLPETVVRLETPADIPAIRSVVSTAFGRDNEADLVDALRNAGKLVVSVIAERRREIVGHVAFSSIAIQTDCSSVGAISLAPVAVVPHVQRQGIGSQLIRRGIDLCREHGSGAVIVVGNPAYYARFGFRGASLYRIRCSLEVPDEVFMVVELRPGGLPVGGIVRYGPEFDAV